MAETSLWKMMKAGTKDVLGIGDKNLLSYIESLDLSDPKIKEELVNYARSVASDANTAGLGSPMPFGGLLSNILSGDTGTYYGQNLTHVRKPKGDLGMEWHDDQFDVEHAPNLLDIFLEKTTAEAEGMVKTNLRPSKGYPFHNEGKNVYDVNKYFNIEPLFNDDNYLNYLADKASKLKPGEGTKVLEPPHYTSLDLGTMNWSLGMDEKGSPYLALADIWDFGGSLGDFGAVMDKLGTPINIYSRFYLDE